jgi:hypothetical protein
MGIQIAGSPSWPEGGLMPRTALVLFVLLIGASFRLPAQVSPDFNVSVSPSIVTMTQGTMASFTVNIVVNERPVFEFGLSGLPSGVIAQLPVGHPGANTIVLTAFTSASTGSFNVDLTVLAGNNPQKQTFVLNVKPIPVVQWEYRVERARTEQELENAASNLGQQSWELVSVIYRERGSNALPEWTGFFKRQKH